MKLLKKENFDGYFFAAFLLLSLCFSVVYKYVLFYYGVHLKYTWLADMMFFIIMNMILIYKRNYNFILLFIVLFLIKTTGSFFVYKFYESQLDYFKEVFRTTFSFTFVFFVYVYLKNINLKNIIFIFKVFKYVSLVISVTVLIGLIFNVQIFETYFGTRFGFSGVLFPQSFSSYFFIISILIHYFYNRNIEKISPLFIAFTTLSALLVGTKAVYIFLSFFILVLFFDKKVYKNKVIMLCLSLLLSVLVLNYKILKSFIIDKLDLFYNIYKESGLLTFFFSFRDLSFLNAKSYVQNNWNITNYLFGGVNRKVMLVEMEFADIFLSFGILGSVFLIFCYYKFILKTISFERNSFLLFGILVFIMMLSGNFFKSFTISYFVAFLLIILTYKPKMFTENHYD